MSALPSFGIDAQSWFERKVRARLWDYLKAGGAACKWGGFELGRGLLILDAHREVIAERVLCRPESFVKWSEPDFLFPDGDLWAFGCWRIDWPMVESSVSQAVSAVFADARVARDAKQFPTIGRWLGALHRGELWAPVMQGRCAAGVLRGAALRRHREARARILRNLKHECVKCHSEFTGGKFNARRCPTCTRPRAKRQEAKP